ncbi:hypothetical protein ACWGBV_35825, partial [Streptomyces sp. NPDC055051]
MRGGDAGAVGAAPDCSACWLAEPCAALRERRGAAGGDWLAEPSDAERARRTGGAPVSGATGDCGASDAAGGDWLAEP